MIERACLSSICLVVAAVGSIGQGKTLFHWTFDGPRSEVVVSQADSISGAILERIRHPDPNVVYDIRYGTTNPWYNTQGTAVELDNDRAYSRIVGQTGLMAVDPGADSALDLSGLERFTIEMFVCPYAIRDCALLDKRGGDGHYGLWLLDGGDLRFSLNSESNAVSAGKGTIKAYTWYHVAATFDVADAVAPMRLYVNGRLVASGGTFRKVMDSTYDLGVGTQILSHDAPSTWGYCFTGRIDELRISDVALAPDQLLCHAEPARAHCPRPEDKAEQFSRTTGLAWQPAEGVLSQRVYFGADPGRLSLLAEVGPDVAAIDNETLGGRLDPGGTYYWRVDSRGSLGRQSGDSYTFEGEGRGTLWTFATQSDKLGKGYVKWLLHLGQRAEDRFWGPYGIGQINQQPNIRPGSGEIWDFGDQYGYSRPPTSSLMMVWTPQYSPTGFFADDWWDHWYSQYYHIYIHSPQNHPARLHLRRPSVERLWAWNNGELICNIGETGAEGQIKEYPVDFVLHEGINSITLGLGGGGSAEAPWWGNYLAVRITDANDEEFTDLTYALEPTPWDADVSVSRILPVDYDPNTVVDVELEVVTSIQSEPNGLSLIEYVPQGAAVIDAGGGQVVHNTIWWTVLPGDVIPTQIRYKLALPAGQAGTVAFSGYLYRNREFMETGGDKILFEDAQGSPADMADRIETVEIFPGEYSQAEGITIGGEGAHDYSGSLVYYGGGLVSGLKPHQTGGWAEYQFSVSSPGLYQILLDYGELWTMYHQAAPVKVILDNTVSLDAEIYPTTHCYGWGGQVVYGPDGDPERKTRWVVGSVRLSPGSHRLKLSFPAMYRADQNLDQYTDGRPVITRIILTNYPGLTTPSREEPHHLDSYEHPPAMIVSSRDVRSLADGCVEMAFHGTFYSLSQGNELYCADGYPWPRVGSTDSRFEIVSIEPQVFHLPPDGQQDFVLTIRSREPVPEDYSELIMLWLQGTPTNPARQPYLFSAARKYITLPSWDPFEAFWNFDYYAWYVRRGIAEPPELFLPDREDLGFHAGRYSRGPVQFVQDQLRAGRLPSIMEAFQEYGLDCDHPYYTWDRTWGSLIGSLYCREGMALQARDYALRLAENMVFYPVTTRWDWARPEYLPKYYGEVGGFPALGLSLRASREQLFSDEEQFRVLHNLVLPIFTSYWGEMRLILTLSQDAKKGDTLLHVSRQNYGNTGSPTDGLHFGLTYIKLEGDAYRLGSVTLDTVNIPGGLRRDYPKGTPVAAWPCSEDYEFEAMDVISLVVMAATSRDPAVIDQTMSMYNEAFEKQKIMLADGSSRNEPGSYGGIGGYAQTLSYAKKLLGRDVHSLISPAVADKIRRAALNVAQFPFSNGAIPHLNGGGCMNQLGRSYFHEFNLWGDLFPEDRETVEFYQGIEQQQRDRVPGDIVDTNSFVVHGWGYAMLRSENQPWDRRMETLLSSKHLLSEPGDHVSSDGLGIVLYGLGAILTPRYGYSWIGYSATLLNQVMVDNDLWDNAYYGSFWHFDGREELPSAVAHTGDGVDCTLLDRRMSRWCIQFPEYLFDAYCVEAKDPNEHQFDWCLINMGDLNVVEPATAQWQDCPQFMADYWPTGEGAGTKTLASKGPGRIVADWIVSNAPWIADGEPTLLRERPQHSGRLRLIMADDSPSQLINAQIGYYRQWNGEQTLANSQDVLAVRKFGVGHVFIDTLEPIANDEEVYVRDVIVVAQGNHQQRLVKVTAGEGEDWVYLSGQWGERADGNHPLSGITTDADIVAWRTKGGVVTRFYLANGSYATTPDGHWQFESAGNYYLGGRN